MNTPRNDTVDPRFPQGHAPANILVVDDTPANLRLLVGLLQDEGYKVRPAPSGKHALSVVQSEAIDLILLDIMMPQMDGYEVCRHVKAQEATRDIPIIFLSALKETFDKVKGFEAGGVDYITKPFQAEEVLARVRTHLSLRQMQRQLQQQNTQLQEQQQQLRQEIVERQRAEEALRDANATKDRFFSIIAHDLRTPFTALLDVVRRTCTTAQTLSREEVVRYLAEIKTSAEVLHALLENLLYWSRVQRGVMEYQPLVIPFREMVESVFSLFRSYADQKEIALHHDVAAAVQVYADINMLNTVTRNLISNALKFTSAGGRIDVSARHRDADVEILVTDTGVGIKDADQSHVFHVDTKTSTVGTEGEKGTGLGLPLCKDLMEKNGGTIHLTSAVGQGTTIHLTLPYPPESLDGDTSPSRVARDDQGSGSTEPLRPFLPSAPPSPPRMTKEELTAALTRLPAAWQHELLEASITLDMDTVEALIARIRPIDEPLAAMLKSLMQHYQLYMIDQLLGTAPDAAGEAGAAREKDA